MSALEVGDKVMVKNTSPGGAVIDEGIAILLLPQSRPDNMWDVEFVDEPGRTYPRFVQEENKVTE